MKSKYKSEQRLAALCDLLSVYIPNYFSPCSFRPSADKVLSPKRDKLIREACDAPCKHDPSMNLYDLQLVAASIIFDIGTSQLLGENEVVVKYFVQEYGELRKTLELINNEYKRLRQFPELKDCVTAWNVKEIPSLLYDDLTQLVNEYNIEDIDIKTLVKSI